jgi:hypothetical protein
MRKLSVLPGIFAAAMLASCLQASAQTEEQSTTDSTETTPIDPGDAAVSTPSDSRDITEPSTANVVEEAKKSAAVAAKAGSDRTRSRDLVKKELSDFLRARGAPNSGGSVVIDGVSVTFSVGTAATVVPRGAPNFSEARAMAFEMAFQKALKEMLLKQGKAVETKALTQLATDTASAASMAAACKPDATDEAVMKGKQIAAALFNNALKKLDVPEAQISQEPPVFRCENPKLKNFFEDETTVTAAGSMAGVRVVKSVFDNQNVGVVIASSPNFRRAAQSIASGEVSRNPLPTALDEIISKYNNLDAENGALLGEFGVRCVTLSNGETAILAFGQSSADVGSDDDEDILSTKLDAAESASSAVADAQIAKFSKMTTTFTKKLARRSERSQTVITENGLPSVVKASDTSQRLFEEVNTTAAVKLVGAEPVLTWRYLDPDSQDYVVGTVMAWSPSIAATTMNATRTTSPGDADGRRPPEGDSRGESIELEEDW